MFAYCGNNPINRVDPTGANWQYYVIKGLFSAALNVAVSWSSARITGQEYTFWNGLGDAFVGSLAGVLEDGRVTIAIISAAITFFESVADGDSAFVVVAKTVIDGILSYVSFGGFLELGDGITDFLIAEFVDFVLLYGPEVCAEAVFAMSFFVPISSKAISSSASPPIFITDNTIPRPKAA